MTTIVCKTQRWGNSIGIRIPKHELEKSNIAEGDEIIVQFSKKSNPLKELFGTGKFSKPTEQLLAEVNKELMSKFERKGIKQWKMQ